VEVEVVSERPETRFHVSKSLHQPELKRHIDLFVFSVKAGYLDNLWNIPNDGAVARLSI